MFLFFSQVPSYRAKNIESIKAKYLYLHYGYLSVVDMGFFMFSSLYFSVFFSAFAQRSYICFIVTFSYQLFEMSKARSSLL